MLDDLLQFAETYNEHHPDDEPLPAPFYRPRRVKWYIHLDAGAEPSIAATGEGAGIELPVPMIQRSGKGAGAMLIVDSAEYVLGMARDESAKAAADAATKHSSYRLLTEQFADEEPEDEGAAAIAAFLLAGRAPAVRSDLSRAGGKATDIIAFSIDGADAHESRGAQDFWARHATARKGSKNAGQCLVCATEGPLLESLPVPIPGNAIPVVDSAGRKARGNETQLVSINNLAQARAGKTQLANTPICPRCGTLPIAALTRLLASPDSRRLGRESVLVWWYTGEPTGFSPIGTILTPDPGHVHDLLNLVHQSSGGSAHEHATLFHAVTLGARKSRAIVHDHLTEPLPRLAETVSRWLDDTELGQGAETHHPGLRALTRAAGRYDENAKRYREESEPVRLERELLASALHGTRPPAYLLPHLLTRINRDRRIDRDRAALLRLCLTRTPNPTCPEAAMPVLNPECTDPAYVAGRVMALLEIIQKAAIPQLSTTLATRYRSAARNPVILNNLVGNAQVHLARLRRDGKKGAADALEARLQGVLKLLEDTEGLATTHTLAEQGYYHLGYYHEREADRLGAIKGAEAKREREAAATAERDRQTPQP